MGTGLLLALALLCGGTKQGEVTIHVSSEHLLCPLAWIVGERMT